MTTKYTDDAPVPVTHSFEEEAGDAPGTTRPVHGFPDDVKANIARLAQVQTAVEALAALISAAKLAVSDVTAQGKLDTLSTNLGTLHADLAALSLLVDGLEGSTDGVETLIGSTNTKLDTVNTNLGTIDGRVDTLEALIGSTNTKLDTVNTNLGLVHGDVDGLEALVTSTNTKLDTVNTNLGTIDGHVDALEGFLDTVETKLQSLIDAIGTASFKAGQVSAIGTGADVQFSTQALLHGFYITNLSTGGQVLYVSHAATPTSTNGIVLQPGQKSAFLEATNVTAAFMRASASGGVAGYEGA